MAKKAFIAERVSVPLSQQMLDDLKSYWHEHQLPSKSEAARQLLAYALEHRPKPRMRGDARK